MLRWRFRLLRWLGGERGQALPLVLISAVVLIGFAGMAIDLARVWVAQQQLQRAVDAATLAAGQQLPHSSKAYTAAVDYSAAGTNGNGLNGWGVTANPPNVTFECVSRGPKGSYTAGTGGNPPTCLTDSDGDSCHPTGSATPTSDAGTPTTCNAVHVTESAKVSTGLLSLFIPSFTVTASSTATSRGSGGVPRPMDVFVILDTTGSMDQSCGASVQGISGNANKLDCAKSGVRALLQSMPYVGGSAVDEVGIMTFPARSSALSPASTPQFSGTTTRNSTTMSVTANEHQYVGDTITGTDIPSGTSITGATTTSPYRVTLSQQASNSTTATFTVYVPPLTCRLRCPR